MTEAGVVRLRWLKVTGGGPFLTRSKISSNRESGGSFGRSSGRPHLLGRVPPSARKMMLWWVISAIKRRRRNGIATIVAKAAIGERAQG